MGARKAAAASLREQLRQKAIARELKRIRQLLELDDTAYSDLFVMLRARQYLEEVMSDERAEELEEYQELEDGDDQ